MSGFTLLLELICLLPLLIMLDCLNKPGWLSPLHSGSHASDEEPG